MVIPKKFAWALIFPAPVGSAVTRFKPGDSVFGGRTGAFAQYVVIGESRAVAHKPAAITHEEAAAVPIAAVTALQALRDKGNLQPGQKVLINGASGGVGTFAVQIAKAMGAEVTGVCSTRNVAMVRSIGADHVIDYKQSSVLDSSEQFDLIIDNVGNHSPGALRDIMAPTGILVMVGGPPGNWIAPLIAPIKGLLMSPFVGQQFVMLLAQMTADDLVVLADMMKSGKLTPVIDRRYALAAVPAAIAYSEEGHARGKIIVNVP